MTIAIKPVLTINIPDSCLAVSAKNLGSNDVSASHFEKAYVVLTENPTNIEPFPNLGFYASIEDMELGVLSALHDNGQYDRCLAWAVEFSRLPEVYQGGALILALSQLKWTQTMVLIFIFVLKSY